MWRSWLVGALTATLTALQPDARGTTGPARVLPTRVSLIVSRSRAPERRVRLRISGRVVLPAGVKDTSQTCTGTVSIRVTGARGGAVRRRVGLRRECRYGLTLAVRGRGRRLTVSVRFLGNQVLRPRSAKRQSV